MTRPAQPLLAAESYKWLREWANGQLETGDNHLAVPGKSYDDNTPYSVHHFTKYRFILNNGWAIVVVVSDETGEPMVYGKEYEHD